MGFLKKFPYAALCACLILSCDMAGMGPIVDLEPPTISITNPARFSYMPGKFAISGTWTDNVKVSRIIISDIGNGKEYGTAEINGNNWSFFVTVSEDGEYGFKATAYDGGNNATSDTVSVFVDHAPPAVSKVEIIRHTGLTPSVLKTLEELMACDPAAYETMDYFQNESIKIRAYITESRRIGNIRLKFYEYDKISDSLVPLSLDLPGIFSNPLTAEWKVTQEMLTAASPGLASGTHYLKPTLELFDETMNAGKKDNSPGFFCWKAESDAPRIGVNREKQGKVSAFQNEPIPFQVFDDDDLDRIYAKILNAGEWTAITGANDGEKLEYLRKETAGGNTPLGASLFNAGDYRKRRETFYPIAPAVPGAYKLVILAADRKTDKPDGSVWFSRALDLEVADPAGTPLFPDIQEIACSNPDGSYNEGDTITFKIAFSDKVFVKATAQNAARVEFSGTGTGDTVNKIAWIRYPQSSSAVLLFDYKIGTGDNLRNIQVDGITLTGIENKYGQTFAGSFQPLSLTRPGLVVDARLPAITAFSPAMDGIMAGSKTIILTFSEPVIAETGGLVQIRPYGKWRVPPVLSEDDFRALSQNTALTDADKKVLDYVDSAGFPLGDPIANNQNYYTKTTHGLDMSDSSIKPDLATKYVLDFNLGLGLTDDEDKIVPLRNVFNKAEWKWQNIDTAGGGIAINDKTVTITLPRSLERGRQWELRIAPNSFRDGAGNTAAALDWGVYRFWSSGTETPVIRVNRISYNGGNPMTGTQPIPDVDVPVRIDCETPGAAIKYLRWTKDTKSADWTGTDRANIVIADEMKAVLAAITSSTDTFDPYSGPFYAGDKWGTPVTAAAKASDSADPFLYKARKDYVVAVAQRPGHDQSEPGHEGVFKTVIMFRAPYMDENRAGKTIILPLQRFRLSGENHTLAGFPFPQIAVYEEKYGKDMYRISSAGDGYNYLWISWEIVNDWKHIKSYGSTVDGNNVVVSDVIDERSYTSFVSGYGMLVYRHQVRFW